VFKRQTICVVVPSYMEEGNIGKVIKTMPNFVDHIVIVDDGSRDKTYEKALECCDERVVISRHKENQGVGAAIITGHKKAIELGADVSVVMAGDGQMDPKYLPNLISAVTNNGYVYAKGNRFLEKDHTQSMPRIRVIGNILLSFMTKIVSGYWYISDPQNGYTAIRTSTLKKMNLDRLAKGYQFENDMLVCLNIANAMVKDVPMPAVYNGETSKIDIYKFILGTSFFLARSFLQRIYKKHIL